MICKVMLFGLALHLTGCASSTTTGSSTASSTDTEQVQQDLSKYETAYFASGCFWCVEAIYESVNGVAEVINGYSGGHTANPTYESSNTGRTGHAEAVEVYYNPQVVSFETLVEVYYSSQDPTTVNGQAPDFGSQYRSIIFYKNPEEQQIAENFKQKLEQSGKYDAPIATEIKAFEKFWIAEAYHQDYEKRNPNQPYIRAVSIPRLKRFQAKHPELLKAESH